MAPFFKNGYFGDETGFLIAFIIGISFGFWLERSGFGSSRKLAMQFYFKDLAVLKVMFTAIITAMTGLLFLSLFGWIDLSLVYISPTYLWPQILGGILLGFGFIIGGYCPGTAVVGSSTGRIDGMFYLGGVILGMFFFGELYPVIENFHTAGALGRFLVSDWLGLSLGITGFLIILMALFMFWGGEQLEKSFGEKEVVK